MNLDVKITRLCSFHQLSELCHRPHSVCSPCIIHVALVPLEWDCDCAIGVHCVPALQVDHSIIMYLVNPKGQFVDYYGQNRTAEEMVGGIASHMIAYSRSQ